MTVPAIIPLAPHSNLGFPLYMAYNILSFELYSVFYKYDMTVCVKGVCRSMVLSLVVSFRSILANIPRFLSIRPKGLFDFEKKKEDEFSREKET